MKEVIQPTILVIFGGSGELTRERLIPALYHLAGHKLLPENFWVIGFSRSEFSHEQYRKSLAPSGRDKTWEKFAKKIFYHPGNFTNPGDFKKLNEFINKLETKNHSLPRPPTGQAGRQAGCANRLFYFATLPSHYESLSGSLDEAGLLVGCARHKRETRVLIEKPFGHDLASARKLDSTLARYFSEEQIYRIDHYLGKETVQNLLTVRFANSIFEPVWNREYIDHVQIHALEAMGVQNRGAFYEQTGALRDFVQNHIMQLVALTAMSRPRDLSTERIRDERAEIIRSIRQTTAKNLKQAITIGQYQGYRKEPNVNPRSQVESFVALQLFIDNDRWKGVPFYIRTGKKLGVEHKTTEISIHFKKPLKSLFHHQDIHPNILTFTLQPMEGIYLHITAKFPGFGIRLHPATMELGYHSAFHQEIPEAYERLLLDFMEGDQRLFTRSDELEYSWNYIDSLTSQIKAKKLKPEIYPAGSMGPKKADLLIKKDGRKWHLTQS